MISINLYYLTDKPFIKWSFFLFCFFLIVQSVHLSKCKLIASVPKKKLTVTSLLQFILFFVLFLSFTSKIILSFITTSEKKQNLVLFYDQWKSRWKIIEAENLCRYLRRKFMNERKTRNARLWSATDNTCSYIKYILHWVIIKMFYIISLWQITLCLNEQKIRVFFFIKSSWLQIGQNVGIE